MGFFDEMLMVFLVAVLLTAVGYLDASLWSYFFGFLLAWYIATIMVRMFAGGGKTMASKGRYADTSRVFLFFTLGIIIASALASGTADGISSAINSGDNTAIFPLSLLVSLGIWSLVKRGLY